ncbi:MAG: hypothetical protein HKN14_08005 [Marinicaulis sp.]|nr:hypothetical protein [Marinicaulis sp.]NNE40847.1 hypothetical protein [Marinicaulis sp.]NNL87733.1 hypothetical protein [Marinicaulis sp.]
MAKRHSTGLIASLFKFMVAAFAVLLIIIGVIVAPSPVPFGIVFIILGFFLLTAAAPDFVRWIRRRWRWLDRKLDRLEEIIPNWLARQIRRTAPEDDNDE